MKKSQKSHEKCLSHQPRLSVVYGKMTPRYTDMPAPPPSTQAVVCLDLGPSLVHYCWLVGDYELEFQWNV